MANEKIDFRTVTGSFSESRIIHKFLRDLTSPFLSTLFRTKSIISETRTVISHPHKVIGLFGIFKI